MISEEGMAYLYLELELLEILNSFIEHRSLVSLHQNHNKLSLLINHEDIT